MQERKLMEMVEAAGTIAIAGHVRPDGDCVGSCLAVCNYITEQYPEKTVDVYLETPPVKFSYLKQFERISSDSNTGKQYELCICLDSGDRERLGNNVVYLDTAKTSICIDHHITNKGYAASNFVNASASATCEFLYDFLDEEKISKEVAECIYTGIIHDTNVFKNSNTTAKTMEVAGVMMEKGINFSQIIDGSFYKKTYVQNQILGRALLESITFLDGKCIFSALRQSEMEFYGVNGKDMDGIIDQLRLTEGVEVAIFMYQTGPQEFKVSLRSQNAVDVSRIASYFGGGGHVRAAGCTMSGRIHDVVNNLSLHIAKQLDAAGPQEE